MPKSRLLPASTALLGALTITGCSAGDDGAGSVQTGAPAPAGVFAPVRGAPPAFAGVSGGAELRAGPTGGTDVSITLRGLRPNVAYTSHLHEGTCDQPDPGGPHFKFDPDGPDASPNEIHLRFTANPAGGAGAQTHSARAVPAAAARSIVVHEDAPPRRAGAAAAAADAPGGGEHHGGGTGEGAAGGTTTHAHATKVACAALRGPS